MVHLTVPISSCQFVSSYTRLDTAAYTSLLQHKQLCVTDLRGLYSTMNYLRTTAAYGITIQAIRLNVDELLVVGYGDCGWANADEHKSQLGFLSLS